MYYKVVWEESARAEVASEFVKSNDKVAIIDASYHLDRALESDPIGNGQPLSEGIFYIDRPPLRAIYSIDVGLRQVDVGRIRRIS